jgi:hypothetical protein
MTDRIKKFKEYLENMNMNLFDEKVSEVTEWITDNSITREEAEEIMTSLPKDYFYREVLENIIDTNEDVFENDEAEQD